MRKITLLVLCLLAANLYSQKNSIIPYILDIETENSIYQFIKKEKQDNIAFYFEHIENGKIKIHFTTQNSNKVDSNRKLFVNDKFYPIIFDSDYSFFVKIKDNFPIIQRFEDDSEREFKVVKIPTIEERLKNKSLYAKDKIINNIDWSTFWVIDVNGKLIETNSK